MPDISKSDKEGYHPFFDNEGKCGSMQVLWFSQEDCDERNQHLKEDDTHITPGWYWWACHPGCLPDSDEPFGPFDTSKEAYQDAIDE